MSNIAEKCTAGSLGVTPMDCNMKASGIKWWLVWWPAVVFLIRAYNLTCSSKRLKRNKNLFKDFVPTLIG